MVSAVVFTGAARRHGAWAGTQAGRAGGRARRAHGRGAREKRAESITFRGVDFAESISMLARLGGVDFRGVMALKF